MYQYAAAGLLTLALITAQEPGAATLPADSLQLLLVVTGGWNATAGTLRRFERSNGASAWRNAGTSVPVVVGRNGLAWGRGSLIAGSDRPIKKEGDGRSPAGAFRLGTAFGQSSQPPAPIALPYLFLDDDIECVDDGGSKYYNQLINRARADRVDWTSAEKMWQEPLYKWGIVVNYNQPPASAGEGSCIFLHIWKGPQSTTAGCTAMPESELVGIMKWLDARKNPLLVQLPREEFERVKGAIRIGNQEPGIRDREGS